MNARSMLGREPALPGRAALVALLVSLLLVLATPAAALAAEVRGGDAVAVGPEETVYDDLYAFGNTITILGTVEGDVVATGNTVHVAGVVTGDVIAAGASVIVSGDVRGSVRAAGANVQLAGSVGEDVLVGAASLEVARDGRVGRDLLVGASSISVLGSVGRSLSAQGEQVTLNGPVGGDVQADAATLRLGPEAAIAGQLRYASAREAEMAPGAVVRGATLRTELPAAEEPASPWANPVSALIGWLQALVGMAILGLAVVLLLPGPSRAATETLAGSLWASLGFGVSLLIGVPLSAALLFALGLVMGGWWLGPMLLAAYAVALAVGYVISALVVGRWVLRPVGYAEAHLVWRLLVGLVIVGALALIPFVGGVVTLAALVLGAGALALSAARAYQRPGTADSSRAVPKPAPAIPVPV